MNISFIIFLNDYNMNNDQDIPFNISTKNTLNSAKFTLPSPSVSNSLNVCLNSSSVGSYLLE